MERRILLVLTSCVALISYVALAQEKLSYPEGYKGPVANYGVEEKKEVPKGTPVAGNRPAGRRPLFFKVTWTPVAGLPEEQDLGRSSTSNRQVKIRAFDVEFVGWQLSRNCSTDT